MEVKILMSRGSAYKIATDSGTEYDEMQHNFAPKKIHQPFDRWIFYI
jgi:hypothetical protein